MTITINTKYNKGDVVYIVDFYSNKVIKTKIKGLNAVTKSGNDKQYISYITNNKMFDIVSEDDMYDNKECAHSELKNRINRDITYFQGEIDKDNKILKKL